MVGGTCNFSKTKLLGVVLAILPGAGLWQPMARAQTPAIVNQVMTPTDARSRVSSRTFNFPLHFDVARNPGAREICLFMKEAGGDWVHVGSVSPLAKSIPCQVAHDGEFGFIVATRDKNGQLSPSNLNRLPPTIIVLVESARPIVVGESPRSTGVTIVPAQYTVVAESPVPPVVSTPLPPPDGAILAVPPSNPGPPSVPEVMQPVSPVPALTTMPQQSVVSTNESRRVIVNTTHVGVDYNVGRQGPSGLGKVEVWATSDQGRTWQRVGEDREHRSPVVADLPGEGVWGIRLAASNGSGFGGKAPSAGDLPVRTIEVDLTSPVISSLRVEPVARNGALEIRWKVTDKNLNPDGINLFFAAQRSGPWQPITYRVKNDEVYRWTLPANLPPQLFFRLEASDLAGNVSRCDTQTPVVLDMTEPDINVTGVSAIQGRVP